ncbi:MULTISPECIES: tetratricopeptide repeat protein [unclassified Roseofilum]|uniref:tetratricopeptide repeat protein n=1 Tax=unclassified Roseofilum TaxID=2620099 RepID=UPI000E988E77|nr:MULTISPECIES: tetratricopeptide repeat protein [unclassified Roseofilum]MBP0009834.1 tetratricopeptide repeat protein [Roseofilum sp. Belize Diploria]MBP0034089.1 tetratricopeptide repeat protein [Roseofilum sp. Belize BBD 4]HBR00262.1 hypothetical protein [Cyanobacteria bacterium UBA11691]
MQELEPEIYTQIVELCDSGDRYADEEKFDLALSQYYKALQMIPDPKEEWVASTWILTAIGDAYFLMKNYPESLKILQDAMYCPDAIGNPFIHLRLGQVHYELGDFRRALDELTRAYMGEGKDLFAQEDPKYFTWVKQRIRPPIKGW